MALRITEIPAEGISERKGIRKAAEIAKESLKTGESIRSIVLREGLMDEATLDSVLDPLLLTEPCGGRL